MPKIGYCVLTPEVQLLIAEVKAEHRVWVVHNTPDSAHRAELDVLLQGVDHSYGPMRCTCTPGVVCQACREWKPIPAKFRATRTPQSIEVRKRLRRYEHALKHAIMQGRALRNLHRNIARARARIEYLEGEGPNDH